MSESDKHNVAHNQSTLVCRGCLREWGEMKNMYQWGLDADFFKHMEIPSQPSEGLPALLCTSCESDLKKIKNFKATCQASDRILKLNLENSNGPPITGQVISILDENTVIVKITAPDQDEKIKLMCPYDRCSAIFMKKAHLQYHLKNSHHFAVADIEVQYYCTEDDCIHNINSTANKFFTGRKHLNQHRNKKHKDKTYVCDTCKTKFSTEPDYTRHVKTCNIVYFCYLCQKVYATNETYLVHLMRKHPKLHSKYKQDRKEKRTGIVDYSKIIGVSKPKKAKYDLMVGNAIVRPLIGTPANIIPLRTGVPVISNILQLKAPEIINIDESRKNDKNTNIVVDDKKAVAEVTNEVTSTITEIPKGPVESELNVIPNLTYDVKPIRVYPAKAIVVSKQKHVGETIINETSSDITPIEINIPENTEIISAVNGIPDLCEIDKLPGQIRVKETSKIEETSIVPKELDPIKITRFPPWSHNDVFETTICPGESVDENFNDYVAEEEIIFEATVEVDSTDDLTEFFVDENMNIDNDNQDPVSTKESNSMTDISHYYKDNSMSNELLVEENMMIDKVNQNLLENEEKYENKTDTDTSKYFKEDSMNILIVENMNIDNVTQDTVEVDEKYENNAAIDNPKNITNDVSLNNGCAIQTDEMSTQTDTFEGLFSTKSQPSGDDDDYSTTVLLADIQTQTSPLEFGISRCNKETQACTSNSMKQTQTYNFDSMSSSSTNFISTETQTLDLRSHVHSDVLLSFNSAETQTCMEDSADGSF